MLNSAIQRGKLFHQRYKPTEHGFSYPIAQWWLALDELEQVGGMSRLLSTRGFAPLWFRRKDYLRGSSGDLANAVRAKASELAGAAVNGRVFFLGGLRTLGCYFSPINCYFIQPAGQTSYSHMLAEVSNTPWNERHYYLLDLREQMPHQASHDKAFHVSPFNPIDMTYQWRLKPPLNRPDSRTIIHLEAHRESRHFSATMKLKRHELNPRAIRRVLMRFPVNTITTLGAIYWQALRLWLKKTPVYSHPPE
ncbi:DUF1365 domain-containing protein [Pseudidiomarina sp.]|uniref:DUF1365 domain-containing protein n=1 Tax=Pseudidiomarina sp. TaxID=2081707 RepID=UPI00299ED5FF|nr:DUF1365 domain-containing protein [Pseudidiomarina sp.]MDX1705542.1 DUF1365 domain-containing protein [Pseudidiomarina sp.]